ncbi:DUF4259 domain-containing protein [Actinomadura fibrosa]|uniref:DUF4259 domain-containing protein n=1 Tax=Actinomadura fibrosa TaxID=111802 RepID=A0ABW2XTI2_9ACTN|nr:DUF4259 domain-containing protein [Actinomadura fibrosa]
MGAWGYGPFESDAAMDFTGGLADRTARDVPGRLRAEMSAVLDRDGYLDGSEVESALAAACLVAARADPSVPIAGSARKYLEELDFIADDELRALAVRVFARAADPSDNEWYALWVDSGALDKAEAALAPYRAALA